MKIVNDCVKQPVYIDIINQCVQLTSIPSDDGTTLCCDRLEAYLIEVKNLVLYNKNLLENLIRLYSSIGTNGGLSQNNPINVVATEVSAEYAITPGRVTDGTVTRINRDIFPKTQSSWYWTGTEVAGASGCVWCVYFYYGYVIIGYKGIDNYVRPVRDIKH